MSAAATELAHGESPETLQAQAEALLDRRRVDAARAVVARGVQLHPEHEGLLFQAARIEAMDKRTEAARALLEQLLSGNPSHAGARILMFVIEMDDGQLAQAERLILDLLRESPQSPTYYAYYSRLMLRALLIGKASRLADEAVRLAPNSEEALHARALCDIALGRAPRDSAAAIRLLTRHPDDARTMRLMVASLAHARRPREALGVARELLRLQPDDHELAALVRALRYDTHWTLLPLWPMQRWGWAGSAGLWIGVLIAAQLMDRLAPAHAGTFGLTWLGFIVYSWAWPPVLRRLMLKGT